MRQRACVFGGHAAYCTRREGLTGKILLVLSESAASVLTNAQSGSTSRRKRGGEVREMRGGGGTRVCGCRMIERNHDRLPSSWWWPADRLSVYSGDPRYFTSCRACRGHHSGWARPTTAPSHEVRHVICRDRVIRCVSQCLRDTCERAWLRLGISSLAPSSHKRQHSAAHGHFCVISCAQPAIDSIQSLAEEGSACIAMSRIVIPLHLFSAGAVPHPW